MTERLLSTDFLLAAEWIWSVTNLVLIVMIRIKHGSDRQFFLLTAIMFAFSVMVMVSGCSTDTTIDVRLYTELIPEEGGKVSPSFGVYKQGTRLKIQAIPEEGYQFVRWEGDLVGNENPVFIELYGRRHVTAVFRLHTFESGDGSIANPYHVSTFDDLIAITDVHNLDKHYIQVNDIDASASEGYGDMGSMGGFPGIGSRDNPFTGTYDGGGYQISNLHFKYNDKLLGFFRYIKDAEIKNLTIGKTYYEDSAEKVMDLYGMTDQPISDLLSLHIDTDNISVGGTLVAFNDGGLISNCHSVRQSFGSRFNSNSGLVGYNSGEIIHSSSETDVVSVGSAGGLVAINSGTIRHSYATGGVGGMASAGGLVGYNWGGTITDSYAEGNIGAYNGGGLVARNEGLIERSAALGDRVSASLGTGGGLVGVNYGEIRDSYALADVSRYDRIVGTGGLVGENRGGTISRSFAIGHVSSTHITDDTELGGFAGVNTGGIISSYWNSETSDTERGVGEGDADGANGLATHQMTGLSARDHMPEFDWTAVWVTTSGYPMLRWQVGN